MAPTPIWLANDPSTLDPGLLSLRTIFEEMHIDTEWSVPDERRFRWWLKGHAQEIAVSDAIESHGMQVYTLTASAPVVSGVALNDHTVKVMAGVNAQVTTLSAFTLEQDGIVRLVTRMTTHADVVSWLPRHFALVAAMQAADAELIAGGLAEMLAGTPAESAHPDAGLRPDYDDLVNIIDGLIVGVGNQRYIIPPLAVRESFRPSSGMLTTVNGRGEMVGVRGKQTPVLRLGEHFGATARATRPEDGILIVIESGDAARAILVDELLGKQEVVIKSLGRTFVHQHLVAGGAVLGDGSVGLILDVDTLVRMPPEARSRPAPSSTGVPA